jgi:hypothetical protein
MMTAFAAALDLLFADPNLSTPALYVPMGVGPGVEIRVMRRSPDRMLDFGAARLVSDSVVLDVRVSDCQELTAGDRFEIAGEIFVVQGTPVRDRERLVWTVDLGPA